MPGADHILSKGFLATGSAAYNMGELVTLAAGSTLAPAQVALANSQGEAVIGVVQEDLDVDKVLTGKAIIGVQVMGIALVISGATDITLGAKVTAGADARAELALTGDFPFGIAMDVPAADGDHFHVLLTPGMPAIA